MADALRSGELAGGLRVSKVLGAGGFGITYLAEDVRNGRRYALKEYYPADIAARGAGNALVVKDKDRKLFDLGLNAFFSEANLLRTLPRREGLMSVRGLFKKNETAYVVMELIEGKSLTSLITNYKRYERHFTEDLVHHFLTSIGSALSLVHSADLIHRDIKPDNIMVRRSDGQPILIDFGAARELSSREIATAMYTPSFAAIEQIPKQAGGFDPPKPEGPWTDIYAVCAVAYYMMCGEKPPKATDRYERVTSGLGDPYESIRSRTGTRYSEKLCDLVDTGCRLDPDLRPSDAAAFFGQIVPGGMLKPPAVKKPQGSTETLREARRPAKASRRGPRFSSKAKIWLAILAALGLTVYGILVYHNNV